MTWWDGRLVGLDFETTAANPEEARIVTAALLGVGGGTEARARTWLADPGVEIPEGAAAIHGVTTERAKAEGRPIADVVFEVTDGLRDMAGLGLPVIAYNARYDLTVLDRECRRHGVEPLDPTALRVVDPFVIDKFLVPFRKGSRRLGRVCEVYGVPLGDDAHNAGADALAACRLAYVLGKHGKVQRRVRDADEGRAKAALVREWEEVRSDLDRLHAAQVGWAAEQAEGLADYFRSQGRVEDAMGVRGEWPVPALVSA